MICRRARTRRTICTIRSSRVLPASMVERSSIKRGYEADPHASDLLRKSLAGIHDRLDRLPTMETKLLPKNGPKAPPPRSRSVDAPLVHELEDDLIALADWLDRERLEGLLDVSDEIAAHQKRLPAPPPQDQPPQDPPPPARIEARE